MENEEISPKYIRYMKDYMENNFKTEHFIEVLKIIKEDKIKYSQNNNGSFINLSLIDQNSLIKIKKFIDFFKDNQDNLKDTENRLDEEKEKMQLSKSENMDVENKMINFEVHSLDSVQSSIFSEYTNEDDTNYIDYVSDEEMSGFKINLKKYKKKYVGTNAKVLKKYRDIARNSALCRSVKINISSGKSKKSKDIKSKLVGNEKEETIGDDVNTDNISSDEEEDDDENTGVDMEDTM